MNKNYFRLFIITLITMPITAYLICDTFDASTGLCWLLGIITTVMVVATFAFSIDPEGNGITKESPLSTGFGTFKNILLVLFIISLIPSKQPVSFYNTSVVSYNNYLQKCQQREGFYDKMYKTYSQKKEISFINQDQFTKIATVIMENRKDGQAVTWKWLQENQIIPFSEFSSFWKDLSAFIESQREDYYALETECQVLANSNNILLATFPNNFYNFFLNRPVAKYHYGFTSDITANVFATGRENLK